MTTLEDVRERICAALETPDEDWVAHAVRVIVAHTNQARARKVYDITTPGGRIRAARELAGMPQESLAKRTRIPHRLLCQIEWGERELPLHKATGMAMSLGVSVPWLLAGGPEGGPRTHGSVLRAEPTPRALRNDEKAKRIAEARELAAQKNRVTQKAHTKS